MPPDVTVEDRPELLALRCPRPVSYLNSVLRTAAQASALPALVAEVAAMHAHCVSRWIVTDTVDRAPLHAALRDGGYTPAVHHEARIARVATSRIRSGGDFSVRRVDSMDSLRQQAWVMDMAFGNAIPVTEESLRKDLHYCTGPEARTHRFVAYEAGESGEMPISGGGMTVYPELGFGLLWGGGTIETARGKGAYSAVLAARIEMARKLGIAYVGLYARSDTSAPIVARQGFERWGEMMYWDGPPPASAGSESES